MYCKLYLTEVILLHKLNINHFVLKMHLKLDDGLFYIQSW